MDVAIGIKPQLPWAVEAMGKFLAGIAKRLEMADGVRVLKRSNWTIGRIPILPL